MSPLQPAFRSYSVPTSPAVPRQSRNNPVTPQRAPRQQHRHTQSFYRSPITPSTPYTPLSLRSSDSTNSSILTTPDNFSLNYKKRIAFVSGSPEVSGTVNASQERSIADIANNWRSRANENGIRVSSASITVDKHYDDDEVTDFGLSDAGDDSDILPSDALLPPFLSKQSAHISKNASPRSRTLAHNSVPYPPPSSPTLYRNTSRTPASMSPIRTRQSQNQPAALFSTPPPNGNLARRLKLKGSLTDPAHTRRREAFGAVQALQNANSSLNIGYPNDMSMELFDIDENEYEHDPNYEIPHDDESHSFDFQTHQANSSFGYLSYNYPSFPQYNPDPFQTTGINFGYTNTNLAESVEHHFHSFQQQKSAHKLELQPQHPTSHKNAPRKTSASMATPSYVEPAHVPVPSGDLSLPIIPKPAPLHPSRNAHSMVLSLPSNLITPDASPASDCSVCLSQNPSSLAILKPCGHPLCSACLTSALNIVGEKDMECAVCKQGVEDFKLLVNSSARVGLSVPDTRRETLRGKSFFDPLFSSPGSSNTIEGTSASENDCFGDFESSFDFGIDFTPGEIRASTPKLENSLTLDDGAETAGSTLREGHKFDGNAVLRIDNVPWDITPSQVIVWLQQPVERVHVLLDSKGKTLSHAYIEVRDQLVAGAILRGEALGLDGKKKERGSVLGRGRRARGVTVTRSGQEELMADLFPHWRGAFDGSRPSLAGLQGDRIIGALEGGLLTENEVTGLLYLIREPDSHFLKVPSLPFHSLISILSKFPSDVDSRVFWSASVRDMLFDVTHVAVEVLLGRLESIQDLPNNQPRNDHGYSMELIVQLVRAALSCKAFTGHQLGKFKAFVSSQAIPVSGPADLSAELGDSNRTVMLDCSANIAEGGSEKTGECFGELAKEFGVEAELVQALAQRLANLG